MSPLEDSIVDMVFGDSPSFEKTVTDANLTIEVVELLEYPSGDRPNARTTNGVTKFSQARFEYTPNIDGNSTIDDLTTEQKNSPGMLKYINVLVHELTHWWQDKSAPTGTIFGVQDTKRITTAIDLLRRS